MFSLSTLYKSRKIIYLWFPPTTKVGKYYVFTFYPVQKRKKYIFAVSTHYKSRKNIYFHFLLTSISGVYLIVSFYPVRKHEKSCFISCAENERTNVLIYECVWGRMNEDMIGFGLGVGGRIK